MSNCCKCPTSFARESSSSGTEWEQLRWFLIGIAQSNVANMLDKCQLHDVTVMICTVSELDLHYANVPVVDTRVKPGVLGLEVQTGSTDLCLLNQ